MRDVLLAFARVHILHHARKEPIFGLGMMEELCRHGYRVGAGTMYPLLHRLHADGLLSVQTETINGKRRRYYTITRKGRVALDGIKPKLVELAGEVLPNSSLAQGRKDGKSNASKRRRGMA